MLCLDTNALPKLHPWGGLNEAVHSLVVSQDLPVAIWEIEEAELLRHLRIRRGDLTRILRYPGKSE